MFAFTAHGQTFLSGAVAGAAYGLLAMGLVLLYRSSRVVSFAHAEIGAFAAAVFLVLTVRYHWPYIPAAVAMVAVGALLGAVVELTVVRRLFDAPRVILFVATAGIAQLLLAGRLALPRLPGGFRLFPSALTASWSTHGLVLRGADVSILVVVGISTVAMAWFLGRTLYGRSIRGAAENPEACRLMGIPARRMSTLAWALAGGLSALAELVVRPLVGSGGTSAITGLDARLLLVGLCAAAVARFRSFPIAMAAGVAIGIAEQVLLVNNPSRPGLIDLVLVVVILVSVLRGSGAETETDSATTWSFSSSLRPFPSHLRSHPAVRRVRAAGGALGLTALAALPLVVTSASKQYLYTQMLLLAVVALSVTVCTGMAGQLSLGQFAFAGLAAFTGAALVRHGVAFVPVVLVATAAAAGAAVVVGLPAMRVRGLMLAVTTFAFALMAESDLFPRLAGNGANRIPRTGTRPLDLAPQRTYYWVCLAVLVIALLLVGRLRRRGVGRMFIAVRSNESGAAALAVSPTRAKLAAFAISGGIAGLAGVLLAANAPAGFGPDAFPAMQSIAIVAIVVVGGMGSAFGAVIGTLWVIGLPTLFPNSQQVPLLASGVGILVVLMYLPGGLVEIPYRMRDAWLARLRSRSEPASRVALPLSRWAGPPTVFEGPALRTAGVAVRFGTRQVVDDVAIEVASGEIVGLIGTNGAGKSTFMGAVGGFVSCSGSVELLGRDVSSWSAVRRAGLGLGRGFQHARSFPDLTVREAVQVALERRHRTSYIGSMAGWPGSARAERLQRSDAGELVDLFGLGAHADVLIAELSIGTRRITELAGLVGLGARILCLDEPTAGIAQRETEAFGPLLVLLRHELDMTLLVIDHDIPLVMSITDRVYCMEAGRVIAHGTPAEVRADPLVVASYLGTDERVLERSDARPAHA